MISLPLGGSGQKRLDILCLGAHCDDIEIGCGGTLLKLIGRGVVQSVTWVVFASNAERRVEALACADRFLQDVKQKTVKVFSYRDAFLSYSGLEIKEEFENIKTTCQPDIVFTHARNDAHQDHRLLSEFTRNTFRSHFILEYEIPKFDGDFGQPNMFVELDREVSDLKISHILDCYASQSAKHWFDRDTFAAVMRLRAMECASETQSAEAFYAYKILLM
jgi:LmbE family N-acetylglucosaminyl deacetylase